MILVLILTPSPLQGELFRVNPRERRSSTSSDPECTEG